jgi:hypothetical protein
MFRVVLPPIIMSAYNCIYSIWYLSHRYCYPPLSVWQIPDAVDIVVCALDDGWKYHPKHVEQFPDINKPSNVAYCWMYIEILLGAHHILHISRIRVNTDWTVICVHWHAPTVEIYEKQIRCLCSRCVSYFYFVYQNTVVIWKKHRYASRGLFTEQLK